MTWIGGLPGRDYSIDAEPVAESLRNTLVVLDGVIDGLGARSRSTDDVDDARMSLTIVRRRLWDAIQRLEAPRGSAA